jgi:uncharacterized membrane protein
MDNTTPEQTPPPTITPVSAIGGEDKTVAILSYITLIGFIVAVVIHSGKKTRLGAYHLRQTLGLMLTGFALAVCNIILAFIPYVGRLTSSVLGIALLVLWIMGLIAAINGEMKPVPVFGPLYQKWFGNTFE